MRYALKERLYILWKIASDPRPQTFSAIVEKTNNTWVASTSWLIIVSCGFSIAVTIYSKKDAFIELVIGGTLTFTIAVLIWVFSIYYFYKTLFRAKQDYYEALLFVIVSIYTIAVILLFILTLLPIGNGLLGWVAYLYLPVQVIIAVRGITKSAWRQTLVSVGISSIVAIGTLVFFPLFITNLLRSLPSKF